LGELVSLIRAGVPKHVAAARLAIYPGQLGRWLKAGRDNLTARASDPEVELTMFGVLALEVRQAELDVDEAAYRKVAAAARETPEWALRWLHLRRGADKRTKGRGQVPLAEAVDAAAAYESVRDEVLRVLLGEA